MITLLYVIFVPWLHYLLWCLYHDHTALCHVHTMITLPTVIFTPVTLPHIIFMLCSHYFMSYHTMITLHLAILIQRSHCLVPCSYHDYTTFCQIHTSYTTTRYTHVVITLLYAMSYHHLVPYVCGDHITLRHIHTYVCLHHTSLTNGVQRAIQSNKNYYWAVAYVYTPYVSPALPLVQHQIIVKGVVSW